MSEEDAIGPGPLSMKTLDARLGLVEEESRMGGNFLDDWNTLVNRVIALENLTNDLDETQSEDSGDAPDLYTRVIALENDGGFRSGWHLEIVEALIEALKGVRLAGAQSYAIALQEKYFPEEEVEGNETLTI